MFILHHRVTAKGDDFNNLVTVRILCDEYQILKFYILHINFIPLFYNHSLLLLEQTIPQ
jgi:hypothetical protein